MKFIKDKLNYVVIFFAAVAIIACLFPFATVSSTTNKVTTSMAMFFLNLDSSGTDPIGIAVAIMLVAIIILSFFRKKNPKLLISIFLLALVSFGITAYYIINIRDFASSVTSASEDVKLGFGCYSIVLCLLVIIGISAYELFSGRKNKKEEIKTENNENVQPQMNVQLDSNNQIIMNQNTPIQPNIENVQSETIQPSPYFSNPDIPSVSNSQPIENINNGNSIQNNNNQILNSQNNNDFNPQLINNMQPINNGATSLNLENTQSVSNLYIQEQSNTNNQVSTNENNSMNIFNQQPIDNINNHQNNNDIAVPNIPVESTQPLSNKFIQEQSNTINQIPATEDNSMSIFNQQPINNINNQQSINTTNPVVEEEIEVLDIFDDEFKY